MGYRVGHQCYTDLNHAKSVYFGAVAPIILPSGNLAQVQFINNQYILNNQIISVQFQECNPYSDFVAGGQIGLAFVFLMCVYWGINRVKGLLR